MEQSKICKLRDLLLTITMLENHFAEKYGLSLNEAMVLCLLKQHGKLLASELAQELCCLMPHTSKILRRICDKGWVERKSGEKDHRQKYFMLTRSGKTFIQELETAPFILPDALERALEHFEMPAKERE